MEEIHPCTAAGVAHFVDGTVRSFVHLGSRAEISPLFLQLSPLSPRSLTLRRRVLRFDGFLVVALLPIASGRLYPVLYGFLGQSPEVDSLFAGW